MKKKIFGIKIGSIFSLILCLIAAVVFWFFVEYFSLVSSEVLDVLKA